MLAPDPVPSDRQDFLARRRAVLIGGSDAAVVCGLKPFGKTPRDLFAEIKAGKPSLADNGYLRRGRALEPLAREMYSQVTGRTVIPPTDAEPLFYRWPDDEPFIGVHLDGLIQRGDKGDPGVLELKTCTEHEYRRLESEGIRDSYVIQLQTGLLASGLKWGSFGFFCPQSWEIMWVDESRDDVLIEQIIERATAFRNYVQDDIPPPDDTPRVTKYDDPWKGVTSDPDLNQLIAEYRAAHWQRDAANASFDMIRARLGDYLTDHSIEDVTSLTGDRITYKVSPRTRVDTHLLRAEHPEIDWPRYEVLTESRIMRGYFIEEVE